VNAALLWSAVSAYGTELGFFNTYLSGAAIPLLTFQKRLRGVISLLPVAQEVSIALALVAAAESAAAPSQSPATWSDGEGWRTSLPAFNIFPLPFEPIITPTALVLPDGPTTSYFSYVQPTPATTWNIEHDLGRIPSVSCFDASNKPISGEATYLSLNLVVVVFPAPIAGFAYLV
jgi:hypothetical protein